MAGREESRRVISFCMASGVFVSPECKDAFTDIKLRHQYRYVIFVLTDDLTRIVIMKLAPPDATYEEFLLDMKSAQGLRQCRYAIYDMQYFNPNNQLRNKLLFFMWSPDVATVKQKMLYSSSKEALRMALGDGLSRDIQANDLSDLDITNVFEIISRNDRF